MENAVQDLLDKTIYAFENRDIEAAKKVEPLEQVVDELARKLKSRHIARLQAGGCNQAYGYLFNDLLTNLERVADHCSNVAVDMIEVSAGEFDTHDYLDKIKMGGNEEFIRRHARYAGRYTIPAEEPTKAQN